MLSTSGLVPTVMLVHRTGNLLWSNQRISGLTAILSMLANAGMAESDCFMLDFHFHSQEVEERTCLMITAKWRAIIPCVDHERSYC